MAVAARKTKAPAPAKPAAKPAKARSAKAGGDKAAAPAPSNMATFTKEEDLHAYREMLLIRRFEEKAGQMYGMGLIGGFCHLYIGQEAVVSACRWRPRRATRSSPAIATTATCSPAAWNRAA